MFESLVCPTCDRIDCTDCPECTESSFWIITDYKKWWIGGLYLLFILLLLLFLSFHMRDTAPYAEINNSYVSDTQISPRYVCEAGGEQVYCYRGYLIFSYPYNGLTVTCKLETVNGKIEEFLSAQLEQLKNQKWTLYSKSPSQSNTCQTELVTWWGLLAGAIVVFVFTSAMLCWCIYCIRTKSRERLRQMNSRNRPSRTFAPAARSGSRK